MSITYNARVTPGCTTPRYRYPDRGNSPGASPRDGLTTSRNASITRSARAWLPTTKLTTE
eukprot:3214648-Pyramimonas_sp.AAC.1